MEDYIEKYIMTDGFSIYGSHAIKAKELVDKKIYTTYLELVIHALEIGIQSGKTIEKDTNIEIRRRVLPEMYLKNKMKIQRIIRLSALFEFSNSKDPFEEFSLVCNDKAQSERYVEKLKGYVRFGIEEVYSQLSYVDFDSRDEIIRLLNRCCIKNDMRG